MNNNKNKVERVDNMTNIGDRLYLNDKNSYLVVSKAEYEGKMYYMLLDDNNPENIKICYEKPENNSVVEILDEQLIQNLGPSFAKTSEIILKNNEKQIQELIEILKNQNAQN